MCKKLLMFVTLVMAMALLSGCLSGGPSVCDNQSTPLCDAAERAGVRLENVGTGIIIMNAVAISQGKYTESDALVVLYEFKKALENPIPYALALAKVNEYPGLFTISTVFRNELKSTDVMHNLDRKILMDWVVNRINERE